MWAEIHEGASIRIPRIFKFVMTYVTPLFLLIMMTWWTVQEAVPTFLMTSIPQDQHTVRWVSRGFMLAILLFQLWMIRAAWRRRALDGKEVA
jgi:hypothetical protein